MVGKKDLKIIRMLQEDARMPITDIAETVGMSENGVRYRLNKLESDGIIKNFTTLVDPAMLGKTTTAVFQMDVDPKMVLNSIKLMKNMKEFTKIFQTTGEHSLMAIGVFDSTSELNCFVNEVFLRNVPVRAYTVNIVTQKYKDGIYTV